MHPYGKHTTATHKAQHYNGTPPPPHAHMHNLAPPPPPPSMHAFTNPDSQKYIKVELQRRDQNTDSLRKRETQRRRRGNKESIIPRKSIVHLKALLPLPPLPPPLRPAFLPFIVGRLWDHHRRALRLSLDVFRARCGPGSFRVGQGHGPGHG